MSRVQRQGKRPRRHDANTKADKRAGAGYDTNGKRPNPNKQLSAVSRKTCHKIERSDARSDIRRELADRYETKLKERNNER